MIQWVRFTPSVLSNWSGDTTTALLDSGREYLDQIAAYQSYVRGG